MRVILASINDIGKLALAELVKQTTVVAVITVKERGGLYMDISDFEEITSRHNVPLYKMTDINSKEVEEMIRGLKPDLGMCMGWNQVVHQNILRIPRFGWLGSHPTKLPVVGSVIDPTVNSAAGNEPVPTTILKGCRKSALSLFWLDRRVDVGDIFAQEDIDVDAEHETTRTLLDKIGAACAKIIREKFPLIVAGNAPRMPQDPNIEGKQPYVPPMDPNANLLDHGQPIEDIYRRIRACIYPYPNAFFMLGGQRVYVTSARVENGQFTELKVRVGGRP